MLSGRIFESLMVTGGLSVLNPKLTDTGIAATNNETSSAFPITNPTSWPSISCRNSPARFLNFDWQHVGRRPIDDINSEYTPQYNIFDFGVRYTTKMHGESDHLARHGKQCDQCALLVDARARQHHGAEHRQLSRASGRAEADHGLDAVRILRRYKMCTASSLALSLAWTASAQTPKCVPPSSQQLIIYRAGSLTRAFKPLEDTFTCQTGIQVKDVAMGSVDAGRQITAGGQACDLYAPADLPGHRSVHETRRLCGFRYRVRPWQDGAGIFGEAVWRRRNCLPSPNPVAAFHPPDSIPKASAKWYEILTMPGVAIGGGNPFLDPGAYRGPMIFQLAEAYYKVPNLYNNMLEHVVTPGPRLRELLSASSSIFSSPMNTMPERRRATNPDYRYVNLPDEIDLSDPAKDAYYRQHAVVVLPGLGTPRSARTVCGSGRAASHGASP